MSVTDTMRPTQDGVRQHEYKIVVNTRERTVDTAVLTFEQVVNLAYDPAPPNPDIFTVTYRHAAAHPADGTLYPGETIKIKNGTVFSVVATTQS